MSGMTVEIAQEATLVTMAEMILLVNKWIDLSNDFRDGKIDGETLEREYSRFVLPYALEVISILDKIDLTPQMTEAENRLDTNRSLLLG